MTGARAGARVELPASTSTQICTSSAIVAPSSARRFSNQAEVEACAALDASPSETRKSRVWRMGRRLVTRAEMAASSTLPSWLSASSDATASATRSVSSDGQPRSVPKSASAPASSPGSAVLMPEESIVPVAPTRVGWCRPAMAGALRAPLRPAPRGS